MPSQNQPAQPQETNNLMDGATYLESLNDGREIWFDGEKVKNVTEHPAFRNAARIFHHWGECAESVGQLLKAAENFRRSHLSLGVKRAGLTAVVDTRNERNCFGFTRRQRI